MAFSQAELNNIAVAALDFYLDKGTVKPQSLDQRPTYVKLMSMRDTFSGGKGKIKDRVYGTYTTTATGYTHNDQVTYGNPANLREVSYDWKEHHAGIEITHTELKNDGITVNEASGNTPTKEDLNVKPRADVHRLAKLLDYKLEDMMEGYERSMNEKLWDDGTTDAKSFAGIRSIILDNPAGAGSVIGGLDCVANTWWRNRFKLDIATTAGGDELTEFFQQEFRILRRFGGDPSWIACGSKFLQRYEDELRRKGTYTQQGFNIKGMDNDAHMKAVHWNGIPLVWEPRLDDLGTTIGGGTDYAKRAYVLDFKRLKFMVMANEWMKKAYPPRPHDQYVWQAAMTTTGGLVSCQNNGMGVYELD